MAYNSSIAEQFEVIQRWVNSGNSTGIATFQNDPLMGVSPPGAKRTFCFEHEGELKRIDVPTAFVELKWGAYLFVPSMAAIRHLAEGLPDDAAARDAAAAADAARGRALVEELLAKAEQGEEGRRAAAAGWKTAIEDFSAKDPGEKNIAAAAWAAIRDYHGGAVRVPYGFGEPPEEVVLVASKELVMEVFDNPHEHYSMCGQKGRMRQSFGTIFLGLDGGDEYEAIATKVNGALMEISAEEAFKLSYGLGQKVLEKAFSSFLHAVRRAGRQFRPPARLYHADPRRGAPTGSALPDDPEAAVSGSDGCGPHHVDARRLELGAGRTAQAALPGRLYGDLALLLLSRSGTRACRPTARSRVRRCAGPYRAFHRIRRRRERGPLAAYRDARLDADRLPSDDELARTIIGVMTGFLPPADGACAGRSTTGSRRSTLWRASSTPARREGTPFERARARRCAPLERAMQKRPAARHALAHRRARPRAGRTTSRRPTTGCSSASSRRLAEDVAVGIATSIRSSAAIAAPDRHPLHACPAYKAAMGTMLGISGRAARQGRIERCRRRCWSSSATRAGVPTSPPHRPLHLPHHPQRRKAPNSLVERGHRSSGIALAASASSALHREVRGQLRAAPRRSAARNARCK